MYQNPYMTNYQQNFTQQSLNEKIDNEIERLKQMKSNMQQPIQPITQNFQFAPANSGIKYASTLEDVQKEQVYGDTPFFSKDFSVLWLKNAKGNVKCYELKEIIAKDEKDLMIESLQMQIEDLRKEMKENAKSDDKYIDEPNTNEKSTSVSTSKSTSKK
jgi:hypothetical protein